MGWDVVVDTVRLGENTPTTAKVIENEDGFRGLSIRTSKGSVFLTQENVETLLECGEILEAMAESAPVSKPAEKAPAKAKAKKAPANRASKVKTTKVNPLLIKVADSLCDGDLDIARAMFPHLA